MEQKKPIPRRDDQESREERLERMMRSYGDRLVRTCALILRDAALAEDAVQDSFLKAWKALEDFRGESSELSWLMRICINTCRDYQRGFWLRRVDRGGRMEEAALIAQDAPMEDAELARAVMALPLKYREAVLLRYYHDLSLREMADILGTGVSTVSSRLIRARERLREALKGWYFDEE